MHILQLRKQMISKNLTKFIRSLEQKKNRKREGLFVAEGPKVVEELVKRFTPHTVVATRDFIVDTRAKGFPACNIVETDEEGLRKISFLQHPQQVLAIFHIPEDTRHSSAPANLSSPITGLVIALDGVQDPGNLGTIIRIADWFGIDRIVCSLDTADAYNPKVVQATMGSLARVDITYTNLEDYLSSLPSDTPIYGTLLDGDDIYRKSLSDCGVIVMGNEGNGISESIRTKITDRLFIPNYRKGNGAESLNVAIATAITCAEFKRRAGL